MKRYGSEAEREERRPENTVQDSHPAQYEGSGLRQSCRIPKPNMASGLFPELGLHTEIFLQKQVKNGSTGWPPQKVLFSNPKNT